MCGHTVLAAHPFACITDNTTSYVPASSRNKGLTTLCDVPIRFYLLACHLCRQPLIDTFCLLKSKANTVGIPGFLHRGKLGRFPLGVVWLVGRRVDCETFLKSRVDITVLWYTIMWYTRMCLHTIHTRAHTHTHTHTHHIWDRYSTRSLSHTARSQQKWGSGVSYTPGSLHHISPSALVIFWNFFFFFFFFF